MNNGDPTLGLWAFEEQHYRTAHNEAVAQAYALATHSDADTREAARRLLWARQCIMWDLFAWNETDIGVYWELPEEHAFISRRFEFAHFFIAHEIRDDGDPGVVWMRYRRHNERAFRSQMKVCPAHTERAWPVIVRDRDTHEGSEGLDCARLIELIDIHEARYIENVENVRDFMNNTRDVGTSMQIEPGVLAVRAWMVTFGLKPESLKLDCPFI